ncbi:MAG TPA: hypothetical protein V6D29_06420 [Leptolyngbyaceae cyanobacterium]
MKNEEFSYKSGLRQVSLSIDEDAVKIKLSPKKLGCGCSGIGLLFFDSFVASCAGFLTLNALSTLAIGLIDLNFSAILAALLNVLIALFLNYYVWSSLCSRFMYEQWCISHQEITRKVGFIGFRLLNVQYISNIQQLIFAPSLYIGISSENAKMYSSPYVALRFSTGYSYKIVDGVDIPDADVEYLSQIISIWLRIPVTKTNEPYFKQRRGSRRDLMKQSSTTFRLEAFRISSDFLILLSALLSYSAGIAFAIFIFVFMPQQ